MVQSGGQNLCLCSSFPKLSIIQAHMLIGNQEEKPSTEIKTDKKVGGLREGTETKGNSAEWKQERAGRGKRQMR